MSNWKEFIYNTDFSKPNLSEIQAQLNQATQGCNVYPPQEQIFSGLCSYFRTRSVSRGQSGKWIGIFRQFRNKDASLIAEYF